MLLSEFCVDWEHGHHSIEFFNVNFEFILMIESRLEGSFEVLTLLVPSGEMN